MPLSLALRTSEDWRSARTARRYMFQMVVTPPTTTVTAGTNIVGLAKGSTNPDVYISRIRCHLFHSAAAVGTVLGWKRAASVAVGSGSTITLADIPKNDTAATNATLGIFVPSANNSPTGTKANQYMLTHASGTVATPAANTGNGIVDDWTARDLSERIRLTGTEGMILDWQVAGDVDIKIHMLLVWEEVT